MTMPAARLSASILMLSMALQVAPSRAASSRPPEAADHPPCCMVMADHAASGLVIAFGGMDRSGAYLGETWAWNGAVWIPIHTSVAPSPRGGFAMAYDPIHREVVLFGGDDGSRFLDDTWVWNGSGMWRERHPVSSPPADAGPSMAWDAGTRRIVGFIGGRTWIWDGVTWAIAHTHKPPSYIGAEGLAKSGIHLVFYGGEQCDDYCTYFGDTWTWNGSKWVLRDPPSSPPVLAEMGMAYDAARKNTVMFGGYAHPITYGQTWTWDGSTWTLQRPDSSPPPRADMAMAYDSTRRETVVFGGMFFGATKTYFLSDTWTWNGSTWTCVSACAQPAP
jgi:hypothetical protein